MSNKPVHFEIHVQEMERAKAFYGNVFQWTFEDWSTYAGMPYWGAITGPKEEHGINGALMQRQGAAPEGCITVSGAVLTMAVTDYDATEALILANGGTVALAKYALPGMAWQGYYIDTEGNILGIHQPDKDAK